jgi:hypothetical protein
MLLYFFLIRTNGSLKIYKYNNSKTSLNNQTCFCHTFILINSAQIILAAKVSSLSYNFDPSSINFLLFYLLNNMNNAFFYERIILWCHGHFRRKPVYTPHDQSNKS